MVVSLVPRTSILLPEDDRSGRLQWRRSYVCFQRVHDEDADWCAARPNRELTLPSDVFFLPARRLHEPFVDLQGPERPALARRTRPPSKRPKVRKHSFLVESLLDWIADSVSPVIRPACNARRNGDPKPSTGSCTASKAQHANDQDLRPLPAPNHANDQDLLPLQSCWLGPSTAWRFPLGAMGIRPQLSLAASGLYHYQSRVFLTTARLCRTSDLALRLGAQITSTTRAVLPPSDV
uniref:Uncharacterized protein n=1 Tax=Mycena chlorophos TaxID=658473 RepID=A0ABQ0MCY6_MYCCL|nr:predicted protein [Mycena chlorophos]